MKIKILLTTAILITLFTACGISKKTTNSATYDEGVVINGVRWATRNVDEPGTFAPTSESAGKFYQWNRKKAWNTTDSIVVGWDNSVAKGTKWKKINDPCPSGWRIPTHEETLKLSDRSKVSSEWMIENSVNGRKFTDIASGNSIFLPALGNRAISNGEINGSNGIYWSSTRVIGGGAYGLIFLIELGSHLNRAVGASIRCVCIE